MELSHVLTAVCTAIGTAFTTGIPLYIWFKKQLNVVAAGRVDVEKQQAVVDAARGEADAKEETAASTAWKELFNRCEGERAEQNIKINRQQDQIADLIRENAMLNARLTILESKIGDVGLVKK
jgi:chromosome segregation ATPase